jgi:hypothetical protein
MATDAELDPVVAQALGANPTARSLVRRFRREGCVPLSESSGQPIAWVGVTARPS